MNRIGMSRVPIYFVALLALATVGAGTAYQNGINLLRGQGDGISALFFLGGAAVLGFALLVLGRIVYLTMPHSENT